MEQNTISRWGLPLAAIEGLGEQLRNFWSRFSHLVRTKTRDTSQYGYEYVSGLLRLETNRTMANLGRTGGIAEQNMQHFMSNSPWSWKRVREAVQEEVRQRPEFAQGSMLLLDESADDKAGDQSVGAARQYNGRLGKVDLSQVGVFVSLTNNGYQTWLDGEIFLPEHWLSEAYAKQRKKVGIPAEREFQTKIELGWKLIQRMQERGIPFEAVAFDTLYGRNLWLREQLAQAGLEYYADVPVNTQVYLSEPVWGFPQNQRGPQGKKERVLSPKAYRVDQLRQHPELVWQTITLRASERGQLTADFSARRVWTVREDGRAVQEWLLLRRDGKHYSYTLSNGSVETTLLTLATRKSQRYFIERSNQDSKSELGWDEFQATKLTAWEHQLALTILASWFITETRLNWAAQYQHDPELLAEYELELLPRFSVANVRILLRAVLPLPQLSPQQAADLVVKHLDNRARSRKSRLKKAQGP